MLIKCPNYSNIDLKLGKKKNLDAIFNIELYTINLKFSI